MLFGVFSVNTNTGVMMLTPPLKSLISVLNLGLQIINSGRHSEKLFLSPKDCGDLL